MIRRKERDFLRVHDWKARGYYWKKKVINHWKFTKLSPFLWIQVSHDFSILILATWKWMSTLCLCFTRYMSLQTSKNLYCFCICTVKLICINFTKWYNFGWRVGIVQNEFFTPRSVTGTKAVCIQVCRSHYLSLAIVQLRGKKLWVKRWSAASYIVAFPSVFKNKRANLSYCRGEKVSVRTARTAWSITALHGRPQESHTFANRLKKKVHLCNGKVIW